jgi:tetratricopeptide (TPR) repeat protein
MDKKDQDVSTWLARLWRKRRPLVIAVAILVIGLPVVIILGLAANKETASPVVDAARKQAQAATEKGDYSLAYNALKRGEGQAVTDEQKVALYTELAAAAANAGQPLEAISYLLKKQQLDANVAGPDAYMLGVLYEETGEMQMALAQYQASLAYYKSLPKDSSTDARIASIEAVIANLEAGNE